MKNLLTEKFSKRLLITGVILLFIGFILFIWNDWHMSVEEELKADKAAQFGDFVGGLIGSIWALAGVILFYVALKEQRKDFATNREVLKAQTDALRQQIKEFELQSKELADSRREMEISNLMLSKQLKQSNKSAKGEIVIKLFNEFRSKKWNDVRDLIKKEGKNLKLADVKNYIHFLNHFGFLLEHKYVDIRSLYETFGRSAMHTWDILKEQINEERKNSDEPSKYYPYQYHFEYLNYRLRKYSPKGKKHIDNLMSKMKKFESDSFT